MHNLAGYVNSFRPLYGFTVFFVFFPQFFSNNFSVYTTFTALCCCHCFFLLWCDCLYVCVNRCLRYVSRWLHMVTHFTIDITAYNTTEWRRVSQATEENLKEITLNTLPPWEILWRKITRFERSFWAVLGGVKGVLGGTWVFYLSPWSYVWESPVS